MADENKHVRFNPSDPVRRYWHELKIKKPRGAGLHMNDLVHLAIRLEKHGLNVSDGSIGDKEIAIVSELLKVVQVRHLLTPDSIKDGLFKAVMSSESEAGSTLMSSAPGSDQPSQAGRSEGRGNAGAQRDTTLEEQSPQTPSSKEIENNNDSKGNNSPKRIQQVELGGATGTLHMSG